MRVSLEAIIM